jgi:hypothetical protein
VKYIALAPLLHSQSMLPRLDLNERDHSLPLQFRLYFLALRIIVVDLNTLKTFYTSSRPCISLPTTLVVQLHNSRHRTSRPCCRSLSSAGHGNLCRRRIRPPSSTSTRRGPTRVRILWDGRILRRFIASKRLTLRIP